MTLAQRVLDIRDALPNRSSFAQVAAVPGLGSERAAAMFADLPPLPSWRPNDRPALLFPVKI
jgi:hypothetical protein